MILTNESIEELDTESQLEKYPKLYQHCVRLYELLVKYAENTDSDDEEKIYIGSITPLITELGISQSYQSKLVGRLRLMGCIRMLKRGSGAAKSKWSMYKYPTIKDFHDSDSTGEVKWRKELDKFDATTQRINDLSRRIADIENWLRDEWQAPL